MHAEIHWISCVIWNYFPRFGHIRICNSELVFNYTEASLNLLGAN